MPKGPHELAAGVAAMVILNFCVWGFRRVDSLQVSILRVLTLHLALVEDDGPNKTITYRLPNPMGNTGTWTERDPKHLSHRGHVVSGSIWKTH